MPRKILTGAQRTGNHDGHAGARYSFQFGTICIPNNTTDSKNKTSKAPDQAQRNLARLENRRKPLCEDGARGNEPERSRHQRACAYRKLPFRTRARKVVACKEIILYPNELDFAVSTHPDLDIPTKNAVARAANKVGLALLP